MSILLDAIRKAEAGREPREIALEPAPAPAPEAAAAMDERQAAEKLFAVKAPKDRRYMIWMLGGLAVLLVIGAAYFWHRAPQQHPARLPAAVISPLPPPPPGASDIVAEKSPEKPPEKPGPAEQPKPAEPGKETPANTVRVKKIPVKAAVNPISVQGYQAMEAGNLDGARQDYTRLLGRDPQNREALLGLAAIAMKRGRTALAERYYGRVLEIDPEDPVATASLVDLRNPPDAESRIKTLLRDAPDSGALYFSLGNQYAGQSLWADAQQAYFSAYTRAPDNPDFAFNLAVSLDHLNQDGLALEYYRRALELSGKGFPGFDPVTVKNRIHDLEK